MEQRRRYTRVDVVSVFVWLGVATMFAVPARLRGRERRNQEWCANNLRQIAMAGIQYSDDKRFYPHVKAIRELDGGFDSDTAARAMRALVFYGYLEDTSVLRCPSSPDDEPRERAGREFHWELGEPQRDVSESPLTGKTGGGDRPLGQMVDLSYGWTRRGQTTNNNGVSYVAADKARRLEAEASGPSRHSGNARGNHGDCMLVVCVDAHTQRVTPGSPHDDWITTTNIAGKTGSGPASYLGVLEDDEQFTD